MSGGWYLYSGLCSGRNRKSRGTFDGRAYLQRCQVSIYISEYDGDNVLRAKGHAGLLSLSQLLSVQVPTRFSPLILFSQ